MLLSIFARLVITIFFVVPPTLLVLALLALTLVRWGGGGEQEQDRCSQWVRPRNMDADELARRAASGSVPAQVAYGRELFRTGRQEEAETWFETAVAGSNERERGDVARTIAGGLRSEPAPTGQDDIRAVERWYRRAFDLGSDRAAVQLGFRLRRSGDPDEADRWFERAVERSGGHAAVDIAINGRGCRVRTQFADDAVLCARWLRHGAELGDQDSMSYYAEALRNGIGVERNETEAFRWYEAAARHPRASVYDLLTLTGLYADGVGTPPDRAAAIAALNAAKGKPLDDSDTRAPDKIKHLERRLNADGADKR